MQVDKQIIAPEFVKDFGNQLTKHKYAEKVYKTVMDGQSG